jgi:hypothetical protein
MPEPTADDWAMSIIDFDPQVDPSTLVAHELNARRHPKHQREALRGALDAVGWVDAVKVNTRTGKIVDGHARVEQALEADVPVPVLWVDLDEEQERYVLATLDPIGQLAAYDAEILGGLLDSIEVTNDAVSAMLADLTGAEVAPPPPPSLDDLDDDHDPTVFWPVLRVKCDPEVFSVWQRHVAEFEGDEEAAFAALVTDATHE